MATSNKAPKAAPQGAADATAASVTLASPYGWYEDDGTGRWYSPGQVVEDAAEVALLMTRKAPLVGIDFEAL